MQPPLPLRLPFEVLDYVRHVTPIAIDPGLDQSAIEKFAGGTDKGMACAILLIPGLFAEEHDVGVARTFAK